MVNIALSFLGLIVALSSFSEPCLAHRLQKGETLASLAEREYGHALYQLVIIKLNRIKDPQDLKDAADVQVPPLKDLVKFKKLPKGFEKIWNDVIVVQKDLRELRTKITATRVETKVGGGVKRQLQSGAKKLAKAAEYIDGQSATVLALKQHLREAAEALGKLQDARDDRTRMHEIEAAHLALALAFVRALMWERQEID